MCLCHNTIDDFMTHNAKWKLWFLAIKGKRFKISFFKSTLCLRLCFFSTCALSEVVAVLTGRRAAMTLLIMNDVCWRTFLHTLVIMQKKRIVAGQTVSGILLTGRTANCTAEAQLAYRISPAENEQHISRRIKTEKSKITVQETSINAQCKTVSWKSTPTTSTFKILLMLLLVYLDWMHTNWGKIVCLRRSRRMLWCQNNLKYDASESILSKSFDVGTVLSLFGFCLYQPFTSTAHAYL